MFNYFKRTFIKFVRVDKKIVLPTKESIRGFYNDMTRPLKETKDLLANKKDYNLLIQKIENQNLKLKGKGKELLKEEGKLKGLQDFLGEFEPDKNSFGEDIFVSAKKRDIKGIKEKITELKSKQGLAEQDLAKFLKEKEVSEETLQRLLGNKKEDISKTYALMRLRFNYNIYTDDDDNEEHCRGVGRSSWIIGLSYSPESRKLYWYTNEDKKYLAENIMKNEWNIIKTNTFFVPFNGIGTYLNTISNQRDWRIL